jgi:hypothetical protein
MHQAALVLDLGSCASTHLVHVQVIAYTKGVWKLYIDEE